MFAGFTPCGCYLTLTLLWLSGIPPGVSAEGYAQILTSVSEKSSAFEYIDLGRWPRGPNRAHERSPRG
jgi:hypothetical protein